MNRFHIIADSFCDACEAGDVAALRLLLSEHREGMRTVLPGRQGFLLACQKGQLEVCKLLDEAFGANSEEDGAMHYAAASGNLELCQWLVAVRGPQTLVERNSVGWSILHTALHHGHERIARWIIEEVETHNHPFHIKYTHMATEAFVLAARSEMWWALPNLLPLTVGPKELRHILWHCRGCLGEILPALPRFALLDHLATALGLLFDMEGKDATRPIFVALARHGYFALPANRTWSNGGPFTNQIKHREIMSLFSELQVMDVCVSTWFPLLAAAANDKPSGTTPAPTPCVQTWLDCLGTWVQEVSEGELSEEVSAFLHLLARTLYGDLVSFRDLVSELLRVRLPCSAERVLEYLRFVAECAVNVSLEGVHMLVEMKLRGISTCPLAHVHLAPHPHMQSSSLLLRLGALPPSLAWPLFRIVFGSAYVSEYVAMGAAWAMRFKRRASLGELIANMHRALIQETWLNDRELAGQCKGMDGALGIRTGVHRRRYVLSLRVTDLMACADERGRMFRLPCRPHNIIYSMLFCVPGGE
jgi:hypothetical protein